MSLPPVFNQYSPDNVIVTFKGLILSGFMDGTFIDAERNEDGFTDHVGAFGDVTRVRNLNRTGKVTITLMTGSASNDALQAIATEDEQFMTGTGALQITEPLNGLMECHADIAWVRKIPKADRAKESGSTVWVFSCAQLEILNAGFVTA